MPKTVTLPLGSWAAPSPHIVRGKDPKSCHTPVGPVKGVAVAAAVAVAVTAA
jgi:hypothetical protein